MRELERPLRQANLSRLLEVLPVGAGLISPRGALSYVNQAWQDFHAHPGGPRWSVGQPYLEGFWQLPEAPSLDWLRNWWLAPDRGSFHCSGTEGPFQVAASSLGPKIGRLVLHIPLASPRDLHQELGRIGRTTNEMHLLVKTMFAHLVEARCQARMSAWELDLRTWRMRWGEELVEVFQAEPEDVPESLEEWLSAWVHPLDRSRVEQTFKEAAGLPLSDSLIHRMRPGRGSWRFVEQRCQGPADGRLRGTCRDVTEKLETTGELRALRLLLGSRQTGP